MTADLHALADAISTASPNTRAFAQAVADILQPVAPPPPSVSPWPANPWKSPGVWNGPVLPTVAIDAHSTDYVTNLVANKKTAGIAAATWSVPVYVASGKAYKVSCPNGNLAASNPVNIPAGAAPDPQGDGHMVVLDYTRGIEFGMYHARYDAAADSWSADYGHAIPFGSVNTGGSPGADDANLPLTAGLLTPEHFTGTQQVTFPLAFACNRGTGPVRFPSCKPGASNTAGQYGPVNGMWMQLDQAFDPATLAVPWERQVAKWLQARGMVCRDGSGNLSLYAENVAVSKRAAPPYPWGSGNPSFSSAFPWNRMRVLAQPVPWQ